jgi:glutathione S-transferase/maleylpyruvate isomerase
MPATVYTVSGSPYAWRLQLSIEHAGVEYEAKNVQASKGEHKTEAYLALNPRGKVPVFTDGDLALYETASIVEYIAERYPDANPLFPENVEERARVRRLICEVDQYWAPHVTKIIRNVYFRSAEDWNLPELEEGRDGVIKELEHFEGQVQGPGLAGALGAADYAVYPFLAHIARYEIKKPDLGLSDKVGPKLRALMKAVEDQPFYAGTYPPHWK